MTHNREDNELFYILFLPLLDYVNEKKCRQSDGITCRQQGGYKCSKKRLQTLCGRTFPCLMTILLKKMDFPQNNKDILLSRKKICEG